MDQEKHAAIFKLADDVRRVQAVPTFVPGNSIRTIYEICSNELFPKVECVLLNACHTEIQAEAISRHVRYVIGMSQAIGDRMISVRLRPLKESRFFPAFALGAHDFARVTGTAIPTNNFNALYLSASKGFGLRPVIDRIDFHLGYGTDWLEAKNHQFVGLFGGVSISPRPFIAFMLEYDAERINCGLQISILDFVQS